MDVPSAASAAATSSCVESGLQPDQLTSAPAARSVRTSTAVSLVTCRQPAMRMPLRGFESLYLSRSAIRTGMRDSAHSIRRRPASASFKSFTLLLMAGKGYREATGVVKYASHDTGIMMDRVMAHTDPVCGKPVDALRARGVAIVDGKTFYFCSTAHRDEFKKDPNKFQNGHSETITVPVFGMTCEKCVARVGDALRKLPGATDVK